MKKLGTPKAVRNFFDGGNRRSEIGEFKEELNHSSKDRKKEALKKVIQAMTVGSDVSSLFPDVVNCMQTNSMDLKKLVYLYVINYAKAQPDLAILAIHSFRKDANDPHNPLLRALAVRTMGCIRLEQMTEYLLEPLRRSCSDTDPYVRKTATMCVAKLYDINPELVEDQGFLEILRDMLGDANPMVVANAVASLCEISASARQNQLKLDEDVISRLLPALNQCSEWGQVFILDALALYDPPNSKVAEAILEKGVVATLHHHNSAVVLSVDITVVRHSVRAIGQAAIKIDRAAERCVDCLLELIKTKVNYVVQEAIVVIRDIFRKYPGKYEIIISDLCENLDSLDEPDAKAAMIWIVGEYAERIDNSGELLESFLESFHEEPASVQHQILTATVKMFLKVPQSSKQLVGRVLKLCTDESTNPDLRDRGYMYWRMLSKSPDVAKQVVLSEKPTISENPFALQPRVLDRLVANISTLASVYHQVPEAFCDNNRRGGTMEQEDDIEDYAETLAQVQEEIQQTAGKKYEEESGDEESEDSASSSGSENAGPSGGPGRTSGGAGGGGSGGSGGSAPPPPLRPLAQVLSEQTRGQQGQTGLRVAAAVVRGNGGAVGMQLMVGNFASQPMSGWAVQMNKNPFGLAPAGPLQLNAVPPNGTGKVLLPLTPNQLLSGAAPSMPLYLEVAIKTNVDVFYLNVGYDLSAVLVDDGPIPKDAFQRLWQSAPADKKAMCQGTFGQKVTTEMVSSRMRQYYCFLVAQTQAQDMDQLYFSCSTSNKLNVYCELSLQRNGPGVRLICCSEQQVMVPIFQSFISELLQVRWQGGPAGPRS